MASPKREFSYRGKKENQNAVESTKGGGNIYNYKPSNPEERELRRHIWERFKVMRDDPIRKEEEKQWDLGDKMVRMWAPERDPEDWRADIILPDGFSAIQSYLQETLPARYRPELEGVESSDQQLESLNNQVFQYAMDTTEFDEETHKARNCAAARGTAFTLEEYRYETREVNWPVSVEDGAIRYEKKEIVDYDDVYTRFVDNHSIFVDPVEDAKYMDDFIYREVISIDQFKALYEGKDGFINQDKVVAAKYIDKRAGFFDKADDIGDDEVEILHYESKLRDTYGVLANNVIIRDGPLPNKHKRLRLDVWTFYPVISSMWGMGIPKIIYTLIEERRSMRNMGLDRNKMNLSKFFIVNDLYDIDEDDLTPRPHGIARINTQGLPLRDAIQALEYGDIPASSIRMDQMLQDDERRAHGIDDMNQAQATGGTATEAAILSEATQKRIALVNTLQNMTTLRNIGIKKWSNIQFFYPAPRMERIFEDNKWREKKVYRSIKTKGKQFELYGDPKSGDKLELREKKIVGSARIKLDSQWSEYLQGNFDVIMRTDTNPLESKAVKRAEMRETMAFVSNNPLFMRYLDGEKSLKRIMEISGENPADWMPNDGRTAEDMKVLAEQEHAIILKMAETGQVFPIPGTDGATQEHTEEHLNFANSVVFNELPDAIKKVLVDHIMEEVGNDPNIDLSSIGGKQAPGGGPEQGGGGNATPPGAPGGPGVDASVPSPMVAGGDVSGGVPLA